jgi:hypothetical protein
MVERDNLVWFSCHPGRHPMPRFGRYGPCLKAPLPRKSSRDLPRKRRQAGSIPAVKRGLKNAGENAIHSAARPGKLLSTPLYSLPMSAVIPITNKRECHRIVR